MRQLDSYILRHTLTAFAFFCFVLAGVIWLTQAVRLIDTVLSNGQSLWRLFEFSLLVLPRVLTMVLPVAGFAAVIYTINKLYSEAELVVMMMSGQGPFALARPVLIFAVLVAAATLAVTHFVAPMSEQRLTDNRQEIRSELASSLIREGRFLHPMDGLTIFIREASETGRMSGLFLHDERDPERPVTYTAEQALLLRDGAIARLIMSRGAALTYSTKNQLLARVQFDEFTYDLTALLGASEDQPLRSMAQPTSVLFRPGPEITSRPEFDAATFIAQGHERNIFGLNALLLPLIALAVMLTGGYQRRGFGKRIAAALLAGIALVVGGMAGKSVVLAAPALWPVNYLPAALTAAIALLLLHRATVGRGPSRRRLA